MRTVILFLFFLYLQSTALTARAGEDPGIPLDKNAFGAISARAIGPAVMGGRISAIEAVNSDPRIIYVGTAGGGLWKSTSGGTTFEPVFDKYTQSIGTLAIDQAHPDTVWVGTGEHAVRNSVSVGDGIYKTTDGGETWQHMGLKNSERISSIRIDPRNPNTVYVGVLGHLWNDHDERGVYKTTDGGKTWEKILYIDEATGCASLAMDPQDPDILYAGMWQFRRWPWFFKSGGPGSGLYRSKDGGKSWQKLENGLPEGELGRITVEVAPSRPNVVYAVVEAEKTALYRSDDLGEHWEKRDGSLLISMRPFYFGHLFVDPHNFNRVYKLSLTLGMSEDGGTSFSSPFTDNSAGSVHSDLHALWIDPNDTRHLILGTDGGVYQSWDRGGTWTFRQSLPVSQFYHVSYDMEYPYNVYGGLQDNGSWKGPSSSPAGIENRDWQNIGGGDGFHVWPDPLDNNIVYVEYQGGNIIRRHLDTGESKMLKPYAEAGMEKLRFNWNAPIALSPNDAKTLYFGAQYLFRSRDRGESWQRISPDLTTDDPEKQRQLESGGLTIDNSSAENHCSIITISESPVDGRVIWVGTDDGNLQVTTDGGNTWRNVTGAVPGLPANTWVSGVEASHFERGTAYAVFDGHRTGDMRTYVYKTTDMGASWQSIATGDIDGYAHVIREDLVNPDLLFLGTEFGLFITLDSGRHWARFAGGLPRVSVRDIAIHPREHDVILATHGRGILIIDDITPIRELTRDILSAKVALLGARPARRTLNTSLQQFPGNANFVGRNPSEVATITYYLKKRHIFGDMRIDILDQHGELIKSLPGGKRKGINRVEWPMRLKPPRVPKAPTLAFGALLGPMVPEGEYTVRLHKGKAEYEGTIRIVADPRDPHSAEDRALQQKTVMQLYRMQEKLAWLASAVTGVRDQARKQADDLKKRDRLGKSLRTFAGRLDALHKTLVATRKGGFLTGEEQLREKVTSLYAAVSSYGGRPTESQLARMQALQTELQQAIARFENLTGRELNKLNSRLQKKKLPALTILSEEEYQEQR